MAPIKSKQNLLELALVDSPLDMLSVDAKERFVESVIFRDDGIAGFYFADLEAELTPSQIHQILSLIGAQHTVSKFKGARIETKQDILLLSKPSLKFLSDNLKGSSVSEMGFNDSRLPEFDDHVDYSCSERATCRGEQGAICMSSC